MNTEFDQPADPDVPLPPPPPPQEKRVGFLLIAFMLGLLIGALPMLFFVNSRTKRVQADAVKAGHAVYKVVDEYGRTEFQWLPVDKK